MNRPAFISTLLLGAACGLAACSRAGDAEPAAQLAARVNGLEISLRQVRAAAGAGPREPDRQEAREALERVIDQELLVQAAIGLKLDRQPEVVHAMQQARRQILARAFIDKASVEVAKNTPEEIHDFYAAHPELFERRRVFRFQEIAIAAPKEEIETLEQEASHAANLEEMIARLRGRNLAFNIATAVRPAEQLPLGYLARLAAMKSGEIALFSGPAGVSVVQLLRSQEAPLDEKQAAPIIDRFLQGRKRLQIADEAVRRLRERASIEYFGTYALRRSDGAAQQRGAAPLTASGRAGPVVEAPPVARAGP
jgi:EpsD family peptidyl-prolyl cis-trans isomerase